jgi:acetyl esterase/lipase
MIRPLALAAAAFALAAPAFAEQGDVAPGAYTTLDPVRLYEGESPGWADWPGNLGITEESTLPGPAGAVYNVSVPTYTAYLPDEDRNTGTAAVIVPGGGFRFASMRHEGSMLAEWLAERGVAAFVLKYRLVQLEKPSDFGASGEHVARDVAAAPGEADGLRTIAMIRERADEYRIDPDRVVMVGFSAGTHIAAINALADDVSARPNYVAPIYGGPLSGDEIPPLPAPDGPAALPPQFIAWAQNDMTVGPRAWAYVEALMTAGYRPEVHIYRDGAHGFGMTRQGTASDLWVDDFFWWMQTQGLTQKPGDPPHELTPMPGPDLSDD